MSDAPSLYRRHRPRTFADVVGQEHVVRTLRNAVTHGKVHHAYLFVGSRGTGKTSMAKILAACLNCEHGPTTEPCGRCDSCVSIASATSLDVIEMDAASNNSVDDIRDLRESVVYAPVSGRHKVYILDEAHMLSTQAWNAFLKTLEEPPPNTIFVLATTEAAQGAADRRRPLPSLRLRPPDRRAARRRRQARRGGRADRRSRPTRSRCSRATRPARSATRSARSSSSSPTRRHGTIATETCSPCSASPTPTCSSTRSTRSPPPTRARRCWRAARLAQSGRDALGFVRDLEAHARDLHVVQTLGEVPPELRITPDRDARLDEQAGRLGAGAVMRLLDLLAAALEATRNGADARTQLELALVKAAAPEVDPSRQALLQRLERLEAALRGESPVPPPSARPPAMPGRPPRRRRPLRRRLPRRPAIGRAQPPAPAPGAAVAPSSPPPAPSGQRGAPAPPPAPSERAAPGPAGPRPAPPTARRSGRRAPSPSPPRSALDLESLRTVWPAVLDTVRTANALCAALLVETTPIAVEGARVTVAFAQPTPATCCARPTATSTAPASRARSGSVTGGQAAGRLRPRREPAGAEPQAAAPTEEEWVQRLVAEFDAEEIDPESEARLMPQPNMNQMLKQVQKMQADMMKAQEELANEAVEASAGGGMVTVTITGDLAVKDITIDPEAIDPEDPELLQDMVLAAVNEAMRSAQELAARKMGGATGGHGPRRARPAAGPRPVARGALVRPADPAADHRAGQAARDRPPHGAAAGLPHPARVRGGRRRARRGRSARSRSASASARSASTSRRGRAVASARTSAATRA